MVHIRVSRKNGYLSAKLLSDVFRHLFIKLR
nr:MAG TPA: hypothetical protein [Caudoviricetes sp.]